MAKTPKKPSRAKAPKAAAKPAAKIAPKVTPALVAAHGLKPDEYDRLKSLIGRAPKFTELGIFSAMWNEHCSYKSSKIHLKTLPISGPQVIQGPGENAGVISIGDGLPMGAPPIARLKAISLGDPAHPRTRQLVSGVVAGIGGYGNSFGVPTVGGQTRFHTRYDGNNLVNAMAVGLARHDLLFFPAVCR